MSLSFASTIDVLQLHPADNVCIATRALPAKAEVSAGLHTVRLRSAVQQGHKIALVPIEREERITKYGQTIGFATGVIQPGDWVHTHNMSLCERDSARPSADH
jgi:altronate hydrolase